MPSELYLGVGLGLTRPSLLSPLIVTTDQKDLPGTLLNDFLKHDITSVPGSETIAASSFLMLPQCLGSTYLGETFSGYICVHNAGNQTIKDVTLKVTLQIGPDNAAKYFLLSSDPRNSTDLVPGASVFEVIHHDVKELEPHLLTYSVSYCSGPLSIGLFRKSFNLEVLKPLDIKIKIYNTESNVVYLEAQVQNITSGSLILENVSLETPSLLQVEKYNVTDNHNGLNLNIMAPNEIKQFLYCTKPHPGLKYDITELSNTTYIGKLDIVWRSNSGERGRLQTSQLIRSAPKFGDLYLSIDETPNIVYLEEEFCIVFKIANTSKRSMEIILTLEPSSNFAWCSPSGQRIGVIGSNSSKSFQLKMVPLSLGLQSVSGIRINEFYSKRSYKFDVVTQVYVTQRENTSISA